MVSFATRNNISSSALSIFGEVVMLLGGGDSSKVCLSRSYVYKKFNDVITSISSKIRGNWTAPRKSALHWDGKLMKPLDGSIQYGKTKEERLPVLISGLGGTKLLGVPALSRNSATKYGDKVTDVIS